MTPCLSTGLNRIGNSSPVEVFQGAISLSAQQKTGEPAETISDPESDFPRKETENPDEGYGKEIKEMISESTFFNQYCLPMDERDTQDRWPMYRSIHPLDHHGKNETYRFECLWAGFRGHVP